ncbi:universal stress protein [soil metagenome]
MKQTRPPGPVVVGIDGSSSALHAAVWAVDEAASREVTLRLIHVIQSTSPDIRRETSDGEAALRAAHAAVTRTGQPVRIDTAIARGQIAAALVAESAGAGLICVGSAGIRRRAPRLRGAIAAEVAQSATCPVAIIHTQGTAASSESDDIAVVIDDASGLGAALQVALDEARLRNATLLILTLAQSPIGEIASADLDGRVADWLGRYPDVQTHTLVVSDDLPTFLAAHDPPVQLTVMGDVGGEDVARMLSPYGRYLLHDTECSVLLVPS